VIQWPRLDQGIEEFQDPAAADKITQIQKELDETTDVLVRLQLTSFECAADTKSAFAAQDH
jgi:hypothetical protein